MPSPIVLPVRLTTTGPAIKAPANARMVDGNNAVVTIPVDVWFGGSRSYDAVLDFGGRAVESLAFERFGRFPDRDATDNVWLRAAASVATAGGGGRGGQPAVQWPTFCTEK